MIDSRNPVFLALAEIRMSARLAYRHPPRLLGNVAAAALGQDATREPSKAPEERGCPCKSRAELLMLRSWPGRAVGCTSKPQLPSAMLPSMPLSAVRLLQGCPLLLAVSSPNLRA